MLVQVSFDFNEHNRRAIAHAYGAKRIGTRQDCINFADHAV